MPDVRHRLLILHPEADLVLASAAGEGRRGLPEVTLPERHTAEVEHLNHAVRERWGIHTTVLRGLCAPEAPGLVERLHVLEAHPPLAARRGLAWADTTSDALDERAREAIAAWRARASDGEMPWSGRGFWREVAPWIATHVGAASVVQTRAWESSCVARVHARDGEPATHYFKALPPRAECEVRLTPWLSGRPGAPRVQAIDVERRWLLLGAFDGESLDDTRDAAVWRRAAATWGRLQATTLGRSAELRALGCVEHRLDELAGSIAPLLADTPALMEGHPEGLTAEDVDRARRMGPRMWQRCGELAAAGIPYALDHGDLWPSNILAGGGRCVVIDWEDAGVSHPFLGMAPLIAMAREWQVDVSREELADEYLRAFDGLRPPQELRQLFLRVLPLGMFAMAVRYWRTPRAVADLHPWMREMVPFFLRHALDLEDA